MAHIFISYSRADASTVDQIIRRLEKSGHTVWVDRGSIYGGEQWRQKIVEAVESADIIILAISGNSISSDNVRKEMDLAEASKKWIIPLDLEAVEIPTSIKYQLAGIQRINMYSDFGAGYQQLLETLDRLPNRRIDSPLPQSIPIPPARIPRWLMIFGVAIILVILLVIVVWGISTLKGQSPRQSIDQTATALQLLLMQLTSSPYLSPSTPVASFTFTPALQHPTATTFLLTPLRPSPTLTTTPLYTLDYSALNQATSAITAQTATASTQVVHPMSLVSQGPCDSTPPPCTYLVRSGDSFSLIAETVYGSLEYTPLLLSVNRDADGYRLAIRPGMPIFIPALGSADLNELPMSLYPSCGNGVFPCWYRAVAKDTYQSIAAQFYGDEAAWEEITQVNWVYDPALAYPITYPQIHSGLVLVLPTLR